MLNPEPPIIRNSFVNYNHFFNPYICHVCKILVVLEVCHWCRLISYCCKEHLELHREEHQEFCLAVVSLSVEIYNTHHITHEEWAELKKVNLERVKHKLGRNLERYEEQILLFAKSCRVCHRQNDLSLVCSTCLSATVCSRHSIPLHSCAKLRLCTRLDIENALRYEDNIRMPRRLVRNRNLLDMKTYIRRRLGRSRNLETWKYAHFLYTDCLSKPLTLLYYIQTENICNLISSNNLKIHVIAGTFVDRNSLLAWEVFLHEMIPDSTLYIIMIGPHLEEGLATLQVCRTCRKQNKEVFFRYRGMTYRNYRCSRSYIRHKPDIIVGFDIDFKNDEMAIVTALLSQNRPLFFTCKSRNKANHVIEEIGTKYFKTPIIYKLNKFASCRPYRDVESDSVFFLHQYLIMYFEENCQNCQNENLDISNNDNKPSISSNLFEE